MAITTLTEAWKMKRRYGKGIVERDKAPAQAQYEQLLKGLKKRERKNPRNV
jgi:hypothetical protein